MAELRLLVFMLLGVCTSPSLARALETTTTAAEAEHRFSVHGHNGLTLYLSDARTVGGPGGGLGIRDTIDDRYLLQADFDYFFMLGNTVALNLGAGAQLKGLYAPAALVTLSTFLGDQLSFPNEDHPLPVAVPIFAVGLRIAPLRFRAGPAEISLLEGGIGIGNNFPGWATLYKLTIANIGVSL